MGTSATVFSVLMYSVWLGNPGKMLSTVHWNRRTERGSEETTNPSHTAPCRALLPLHTSAAEPLSLFTPA